MLQLKSLFINQTVKISMSYEVKGVIKLLCNKCIKKLCEEFRRSNGQYKMLSYRRETALQGALQFSPKVEDWNWETILYGHYTSIFNHSPPENLSNSVKKTLNKGYYGVQGHSRSSRSVPIESPYAISY